MYFYDPITKLIMLEAKQKSLLILNINDIGLKVS